LALGFVYFIVQGLFLKKDKDTVMSAAIGFAIMAMYVAARRRERRRHRRTVHHQQVIE